MEKMFSESNKKNSFNIQLFSGLSIGCFIGTSYGFFIGFGKTFYTGTGLCVVYPSRNPFLHKGYLSGCYCGIALGVGVNTGIICSFGIKKNLKKPFLNFSNLLKNIGESKHKS